MITHNPGWAKPALRTRTLIAAAAVVVVLIGYLVATTLTANAAATLLSQGKPAIASSSENAGTPASAAVDGNAGTRWSSAFSDPQWIQVDLGSTATISQVVLNWEAAYATAYQIQTSTDGATWNTVYSTTTSTGGNQTLTVTGSGRYVRVYGTVRATQWGYSLWEFQVFGEMGSVGCGSVNTAQGKTATASSTENAGTPASAAVDGNAGSRWSSAFSDPQWLQIDFGVTVTVCQVVLSWETAYATAFQVQISADASTWASIYSTTTGTGGTQTLTVNGTGRFLRIYGTARATPYGYSLWELTAHTIGDAGSPTPSPTGSATGTCPWVNSTAPVSTRVTQLLGVMTQDEKISMLHGNGAASPYIGDMSAIPSLCIPAVGFHDGPVGVGDGFGGVTQMPSATTSAATFDTALELQYGAAVGAEFAGKGAGVALGPTLNIIRDPRWGRAFETFSEDPFLTAQMAVANIKGIQSQGVMAQAKHLAVYNQETYRNGPQDNAIVDTRTLQEIYLPAFQAVSTQGATASYMCAYSTVNGTFACDHAYLQNTALYQQAGFGGFITSDWGAAHSTVAAANNGMTLEMPGGYFFADFLKQAVANGQVSQGQVDTMVRRVLTQYFAFGLFDRAPTGNRDANVTTAAHQAVALKGAEEGIVLLKNTGILPLSTTTTRSIAVIGVDGGAGVQSIGGGSATVTSSGTVWPITGIQTRVAGTGATATYNDGTNQASAVTLAQNSNVAIVFASNNYGNEGSDQTTIDLPNNQNALISAVAAANPNTIVVLNTNSASTMPWLNQVKAVFEGFYPGQQYGTAIAELLFGDVNPSGKLPVTFPVSLADVPAHTTAQWPGDGTTVQYSEALKVGYRWYDAQNITPLYPFGFGLSYTTFSFSNLQVGALTNGQATVTATVTNTGTRAGTEVAQLYVAAPAAVGEPPRSLKGFQRVTLNAGQAQTVTFTVTAHDLAHWDITANNWVATAGAYQILVGNSSRNLPVSANLTVGSTITGGTAGLGVAGPGGPVNITNPYGASYHSGVAVSLQIQGDAGLTYTATGLPAGLSISAGGLITGSSTAGGTSTVIVTGTAASGAKGTISFVWTIS